MRFLVSLLILAGLANAHACDLCAVYRATDERGDTAQGWVFSLAEQFIPHRTSQLNGEEVSPLFSEHVDVFINHFVVGYNVSSRFGISLNVPLTHLDYRRRDLRYSLSPLSTAFVVEDDDRSGLGDLSLIGRFTVFRKSTPTFSFVVNALAGVKFPTGNDDPLEDEIEQTRIFDSFPGNHDDPLSHSRTSVHARMVSLGSGSFDGVFGLTINADCQRWFFNGQFQYYLRTEGDSGYKYGNELIVSGGPGFQVLRNKSCTLGLQANAVYDWMARDELLGRISNRTGMTAWYLGPLVTFTWGSRFSANAGVDLPLEIRNHGFQVVPDYRLHGGITWRF